ncbi:MAG: 30S ribosomal protein S3ae [Candidatus Asgardarchaeia archaeon]
MSRRRRGSRYAAALRDKWKQKKWYSVLAPSYFGNIEIAEVPASDPSLLYGRVVETTLYNITGDFSQIHILLYFQIIDVKGETAYTRFKGHDLTRDYLKSLIRRGTSFVDGIFKVTTKDGYVLRVYPSAFTRYRIQTSKDVLIRKEMLNIVETKAQNLTFEQFVREMVLGKIASEIYNRVKKIVPLRRVEVRKSKLLYAPEVPVVSQEEASVAETETESPTQESVE